MDPRDRGVEMFIRVRGREANIIALTTSTKKARGSEKAKSSK